MITLRNIEKSYGAQELFKNASLQINKGDRFALLGPNGAGKSTLFKIIMGAEEADRGEVSLSSGVSFGYLPQETASLSGRPLVVEVLDGDTTDGRREAKAKKILMGLGFKITDFERPVSELSGGWKMRAMIARLFLQSPDLLLLDEPTNHLDLESLLWFQNYLHHYPGALFLISHDREFINATCKRIVELKDAQLKVYTGSYEKYAEQKKAEEKLLIKAYNQQKKEIKDLETYINRFRAKASLAASVQSKIKFLNRIERIELPHESKSLGFSFPQPERSGQNVLTLEGIKQSYDGKSLIYDGLDLILERGQKIALIGPNGAGKSTLLKLLAGNLAFQSGKRKVGHNVEVGYFSQHRQEMFKKGRTVYEEARNTKRTHSETGIRTLLGSFLFSGEAVNKRTEVLSGGEKSRLGLAKILLDPPNFLLMDEPTTHLDMASVDILISSLKDFEGTFCFISHDVYFIRQLATQVIHINKGKTTWYPGNYDYFLHKKALEEGEEAELFRSEEKLEAETHDPSQNLTLNPKKKKKSGKGGKKSKERKRQEAEERNARYRAAQGKKAETEKDRILKNEENEIIEALTKPETHKNPEEIKKLTKRLGKLQKGSGP